MEAKKIKLSTLAIAAGAAGIVETATALVIGQGLLPPLVGVGMARLLDIFLFLLIVRRWETGLAAVGLARATTAAGLIKGLLWSAAFGGAAAVAALGLQWAGFNLLQLFHTSLPAGGTNLLLFFLVGVLIGPVAEEIFFRGILYGFLRRWGVATAMLASTLLFVFAHPVSHRTPLTQAVGGLVFAAAYEREKSLVAPIVIHALGNLALFSLAVIG